MKISIKVKTGDKLERVEQVGDKNYLASVKAEPIDNMANEALVKLLALHFGLAPSAVKIVRGHSSRHKIIDIPVIFDGRA